MRGDPTGTWFRSGHLFGWRQRGTAAFLLNWLSTLDTNSLESNVAKGNSAV